MHNVLELITQEETARCQVHLKSRERTGNRMQCFQQGVTNQETSSGRSLLEGNEDLLLSQANEA